MTTSTPRIAIIGAGPSAFFAADALLKSDKHIAVDMFERLPFPFGLLRYGVAPDHQKIKQIATVFEATMKFPRFRLFANVEVGRDISLNQLRESYDAVLLAYGAGKAAPLNVPGENLSGSFSAMEFVGWYNGHPDYVDLTVDLSHTDAVVVGNGNVALDVCRILASPLERLRTTDISLSAFKVLKNSNIQRIHLVGRRGLEDASFTNAELRELATQIPDCAMSFDKSALPNAQNTALLSERAQRNIEILRSTEPANNINAAKNIVLHTARSVDRITGFDKVTAIVLAVNRLAGEIGKRNALVTQDKESLDCGLVISSIGYRSRRLEGCPFNPQRGVVPNIDGRVTPNQTKDGKATLYVTGWLKRGAIGVIGTNRADATETAAAILADLSEKSNWREGSVEAFIKPNHTVITVNGWARINEKELSLGRVLGRVRRKLSTEQAIKLVEGSSRPLRCAVSKTY